MTAPSGFSPLHVSGNQLENTSDQDVFLHGVNRAGTEYSCYPNDDGFYDGTGSNYAAEGAEVASMADWGINSEMITLNEDCWLGINGMPAAYSNSSSSPPTPGCSSAACPYAYAIQQIVNDDEAHNIYPVISLFAIAPGTTKSTGHNSLLDNDHAPLFWEEVADYSRVMGTSSSGLSRSRRFTGTRSRSGSAGRRATCPMQAPASTRRQPRPHRAGQPRINANRKACRAI